MKATVMAVVQCLAVSVLLCAIAVVAADGPAPMPVGSGANAAALLPPSAAHQPTPALRYEAPNDCEWWPHDNGGVALSCKLRTINSEYDQTNFSVIPPDLTTSLRIVCSDAVLTKSTLDEQSFAHLVRLRELTIENCKLENWQSGVLSGLSDLRNLTITTRNTEWENMSLQFAIRSFLPVTKLERLDLSYNNIWKLPESIFCPLNNLITLNVSHTRLQDITNLGFREVTPTPQPLMSPADQTDSVTMTSGQRPLTPSCLLDIQVLDASFNMFGLMPANGFSLLRRLRDLHLQNNGISVVTDRALAGLKNLQQVDLSSNKIATLPRDLFRECGEDIRQIYLQNNSISTLPSSLFQGLEHLLALDLSNNHLSTINNGTFSRLIRLVLLNLSHNRISELDRVLFKDLYTLQILNLEHNRLHTIPSDAFAPMNNLHTLILSYNQIKYLDAYSLNGLYVLSLLSLDNNILEGAHPDSLQNCTGLQDLNLNGNALTTVPTALKNMNRLKTVDLGENSIASLDEPGMMGMTNLYGLRLIGNQLTTIRNKNFNGLPSLQILNLARNNISQVDAGAFDNNTKLEAIRLDGNYLTDISGLFVNVQDLLWLNISDNQLEHFDYSQLPPKLQWLDIHSNHIKFLGNRNSAMPMRLQTLDASYNKLTKVSGKSIPNSVELLFLNDNLIQTVEPNTFLNKVNLTRVDLYANQIGTLDLSALQLTEVRINTSLPEFYIGGNPFLCDCTMEWLQRTDRLERMRQHPKIMDLESIYCRLLYNREKASMPLNEVEPSQFLCKYKAHCYALCHCCDYDACDCENTCPSNCTCYHDQSWSANVVDCSAAGYTKMPSRIPMDATEVYLDGNDFGELTSHAFIGRKNLLILYANNSNIAAIYNQTFSGLKKLRVLHLENNNIKQLLGYELVTVEDLRELYLQNNEISFIDNRTFLGLKKLEVLRLEGNRLSTFAVWELSFNPYLVNIGLGDNAWSCECQYVKNFQSWLRDNLNKTTDQLKIGCVNNGRRVGPLFVSFNSTSCVSYTGMSPLLVETELIPLVVITLCVLVACSFLACIAFFYRRELRVWVYYRCGLRMCYKTTAFEEEQDRDRLFDAYISYSIKDEPFVSQALASGLEQSDPSYRLCLHYRDFNVSAYVADTIVEAVESSRRTIIVLSQNFLHSEWCRFEFKSALHEVLKDRRRRLIVVLLGDLPQRDLDPDLRLYLKTNTVIEWGDRLFWQKLRFAMPDVKRSGGSSRGSTRPHHHHPRAAGNLYSATTPLHFERPPIPPPPSVNHGSKVAPPPFLHRQTNNFTMQHQRQLHPQHLWT